MINEGSTSRAAVLLAGADERSTLAAARSLGRRGVSFVVVGVTPKSVVAASRHVRPRVVSPAPSPRHPDYVDFLLEVVRTYGVQLVLPLTDSRLLACDRHRGAIEAMARLAAPSSYAVRNVNDKRMNLTTAQRLGIPCPEQYELESLEDVPELVDRLGFPMVLKDPGPTFDRRPSRFDFTWLVAHDVQELDHFLKERCPSGVFPMFQRFVTGEVRNVCCFAVGGNLVALHEYRDIRRLGGLSVFREATPVSPKLRQYAEAMLRELDWDGAAHLEFFVRQDDGDVRYMETNGRFWASLEGPVGAGWDFPYWTFRYFVHGELPSPPSCHNPAMRSRWHFGDLRALLRYLAGNEEPNGAGAGRGRARAVIDYLFGFRPGIHPDVFRLDDPLPELVEHWRGLQKVIGEAPVIGRIYRALLRLYRAARS